jgi:hypothetical protein
MRSNVQNARNEAREERKREMLAAGLLSDRFPGVASIVVTMNYNRGSHSSLLRTLNFYPGSPAFFKISSLGGGEDEGGLDLTNCIHRMVRGRERTAKGEFKGGRSDEAIVHPNVDYEVAISYS